MIGTDFGFGAIEAELWRLVFVMIRLGAALMIAPFFGAGAVPVQVRIVVTGALAVLVCAWTPLQPPPAELSAQLLLVAAGEVLIGLAMGLVLQIAFAAPVMAAEIISGTMGMSMATAADPSSGGNSTALGQYFSLVLSLIFLALGCHLQWFALVIHSYEAIPPGMTWGGAEWLERIPALLGTALVTALTMALPVTLVLLIVQVLAGVLSRSAPSLNLFALGLPAGILAGICALILSAPLLATQLTDLSALMIDQTHSLLSRGLLQ